MALLSWPVRSFEDCDWAESRFARLGEPVWLIDSEPERGMPREKEPDERMTPEKEPERGMPFRAGPEEESLARVGGWDEGEVEGGCKRTGDCSW